MALIFHYLPYILGAGLAVLILVCFFNGGGARKHIEPRRPKQIYHRWDDDSAHRR